MGSRAHWDGVQVETASGGAVSRWTCYVFACSLITELIMVSGFIIYMFWHAALDLLAGRWVDSRVAGSSHDYGARVSRIVGA